MNWGLSTKSWYTSSINKIIYKSKYPNYMYIKIKLHVWYLDFIYVHIYVQCTCTWSLLLFTDPAMTYRWRWGQPLSPCPECPLRGSWRSGWPWGAGACTTQCTAPHEAPVTITKHIHVFMYIVNNDYRALLQAHVIENLNYAFKLYTKFKI